MTDRVRLYAGTQHGLIVWRSKNGGWEEVSRGFEDGIIDSIYGCHRHPERAYVGVTHNGLYRTEDGGRTWHKILEDRKSTRLNSSHIQKSRMPSSA